MVSEKTLAIIVTICITSVVTAAVMQIARSNAVLQHPLTAVPRSPIEQLEYDPAFYDTVVEDIPGAMRDDPKSNPAQAPVVVPRRQTSGIPGLTALAFIVGNVETGEIYMEFNSKKPLPVASMSKLVTAFVATDMMPKDATIEVSSSSLMAPPDRSNLQAGEKYQLSEILYPMLLDSSNVAAEAISSSTGDRPKFMEMMRSYAWEIGMPDSYFADPSGVSSRNVATGRDLFALSRYLMQFRPDILKLTLTASTSVATTTDHGAHQFSNIHPFVHDPRFIGGKTGRTPEAGETMMTIMSINGKKVAVVVLASLNRASDTRILFGKVESMTVANSQSSSQ